MGCRPRPKTHRLPLMSSPQRRLGDLPQRVSNFLQRVSNLQRLVVNLPRLASSHRQSR